MVATLRNAAHARLGGRARRAAERRRRQTLVAEVAGYRTAAERAELQAIVRRTSSDGDEISRLAWS